MHLISALAAGVKGAESGTAEIYVRGTSSRANYYLDQSGTGGFEATSTQITSGADIDLDSNGGASVYVSQFVRVQVYDENGTLVRTFTDGVYDDAVEVRSTSFTGVGYETLASALSNPVALGTVLDAWITSAGAGDFKVLFEGSDFLIKNILGRLTGFFFNVKSPEYGALGNGTTDDRQAIQDAIDACETAGGGIVFFPAGTYHMEDGTALDVPDDVNLLGLGPSLSVLSRDHATADLLTFPDGNTKLQTIHGLGFADEVTNTGSVVEITGGGRFVFRDCEWVDPQTQAGASDGIVHTTGTTETWVAFERCRLTVTNPTGQQLFNDGGGAISSHLFMSDCEIVLPASRTVAPTLARYSRIVGCYYNLSVVDSNLILVQPNPTAGDTSVVFIGNRVSAPSGGTPRIVTLASSTHHAIGPNDLDAAILPLSETTAGNGLDATLNENTLLDRVGRVKEFASTGDSTYLCDFVNYNVVWIRRTTSSNFTVTATVLPGARATLYIRNSSGSPRTVTFSTGFGNIQWDTVIATTSQVALDLVCVNDSSAGGTYAWRQVGDANDFS